MCAMHTYSGRHGKESLCTCSTRDGCSFIPGCPDCQSSNRRGYWLTFDWQISYEFGKPEPVTPETPKPGYDKEGKKILGEKAVAPPPEGSRWGIRAWLAGTKLTFGINDIFDTAPPYENNPTTGAGYDSSDETPFQRYFYVEIEKKF
jgi:hypothetical protein